ncbi:MAG: 3-methyl-2-oxobutanoate dehydrogenase subunit VorB [Thermoanaerobaculia bacterium]
MPTGNTRTRPKPFVMPHFCKACGRCIDACPKDCISLGTEIESSTGFTPVVLDLEACNGCGLCFSACPEPYGLAPVTNEFETELFDPEKTFGPRQSTAMEPVAIPDERIPLPDLEPLVLKGNHAAAIGAILAGCRHFFGYPITPSTEGAELMAKLLPQIDGVFVQAVSEVATINMMYGCGGAGMPCMTFTSSPGFSLMVEGISYMIGAEVPGVIVDVMRGGPGLGNIAPEQADIKLLCRGLGHGNTHAPVLAPSTPQEMLEMAMLAFELAFKYRHPVVIAGDGYLGQMTGRVTLPDSMIKPGMPEWAVWGDEMHRGNLISSIFLAEPDLEAHNIRLNDKYERMSAEEQRADLYQCEDADWLIVACNTPARMAKGAVQKLRQEGIKAGLFRPITLWPFPIDALASIIDNVEGLLVVEGSNGQLEDELRLAMSHAGTRHPRIENVRHFGGILPSLDEIVDKLTSLLEVAA